MLAARLRRGGGNRCDALQRRRIVFDVELRIAF